MNDHGRQKKTPFAETVINSQLETLLVHNKAFKIIDSKIVEVQKDLKRYDETTKKMLVDFQKWLHAVESRQHLGYHFLERPKAEIEKLKRQTNFLENGNSNLLIHSQPCHQ